MTQQQPEYVWEFPPERRKRGRIWLIILLALAAVAIAVAVFFLFFRPGSTRVAPQPSASSTASASATPTPSETASSTPTPTEDAEPGPEQTAPPAPVDPDISVFRDKVAPVLDDADRGLSIAADSNSREAAQTIELLQQDAGRLSDTPAPSSITERWASGVAAYAEGLRSARAAYDRGETGSAPLSAARGALADLRSISGAA